MSICRAFPDFCALGRPPSMFLLLQRARGAKKAKAYAGVRWQELYDSMDL